MILRKREEAEGTNLFVCEGPHSEELLPGVKMNFIQNLAFIDHPMETEAMERGIFYQRLWTELWRQQQHRTPHEPANCTYGEIP